MSLFMRTDILLVNSSALMNNFSFEARKTYTDSKLSLLLHGSKLEMIIVRMFVIFHNKLIQMCTLIIRDSTYFFFVALGLSIHKTYELHVSIIATIWLT